MKKISASLALAVLVFVSNACGSANTTSSASSTAEANDVRSELALTPVSASLGDIRVQTAPAPAAGIWSEIDVEFIVPCSVRGAFDANVSYVMKDGKVQVLAAGYVFGEPSVPSELVCEAFSIQTKTIIVSGFVSADDVQIVDLAKDSVAFGSDYIGFNVLSNIRVLDASPICPQAAPGEMACMAFGSNVVLDIERSINGCNNKLASVTAEVISQDNNKVVIAVHAIEAVHKFSPVVLCESTMPVEATISVPATVTSADQVELVIVR